MKQHSIRAKRHTRRDYLAFFRYMFTDHVDSYVDRPRFALYVSSVLATAVFLSPLFLILLTLPFIYSLYVAYERSKTIDQPALVVF